jgi:hypothetical protein
MPLLTVMAPRATNTLQEEQVNDHIGEVLGRATPACQFAHCRDVASMSSPRWHNTDQARGTAGYRLPLGVGTTK